MTDQELLQKAADEVSRVLRIPNRYIDNTKFVRLFVFLYAANGGDDELMRHWMNTHNKDLGFCPAAMLTDENSLDKIIAYLDWTCNGF